MHLRRTAPPPSHARRFQPDAGPTDRRRIVAAVFSAILPGLGQLINGRGRLGRRFLAPVVVAIALVLIALQLGSPMRLAASLISPGAMAFLLVANVALLIWRLFATLHAFFDRRYPSRTSRGGLAILAVLCLTVAIPHVVAHAYGSAARDTFAAIFETDAEAAGSGPASGERLNVLIVGIDKIPGRVATLTDSMMVASIDPVGDTMSMLSIPRDLARVPLGTGDTFAPKLNSLMSFADRNPNEFPDGGMRALQDAVGALLGIRIHYYAQMDFIGFAEMIDAVGGIDIDVERGFSDPDYDGYGLDGRGWSVEAGPNHFTGYEALAYARVRKAAGESDFTRSGRQQEILIALRDRLTQAGSLLFGLPGLLEAMESYVRTDLPSSRLPELAAIVDEMGSGTIARAVLRPPLIKAGVTDPRYGAVQTPNLEEIRAVAAALFSEPGTPATPWPTPTPGPSSEPGASTAP